MVGIIGIHGVGKQFLGRQQLLELWRPALGDGVERAVGRASDGPDLDLVYYGDLFRGRATDVPRGKGLPRQQGQGELDDVLADATSASRRPSTVGSQRRWPWALGC
ncbi:MAG: hypothetical protein JXA67_06560 [Micromonosporaceae bacterium]|nr:hypothetical protein [Micromonosporaceae bacterium]